MKSYCSALFSISDFMCLFHLLRMSIIELHALLCKHSLSNFGKVLDLTYKILYVLGPSPLQNLFFQVKLPCPIASSHENETPLILENEIGQAPKPYVS